MTGSDFAADLGEARTILLKAPPMSGRTDEVCADLLAVDDPGETSVLWVSFTTPAPQCLAEWRAHHDVDPAAYGVIAVGDTPGAGAADDLDPAVVESISTPSDLTGIGIAVGEFLADMDGPVAVCVDSLTALLQYVDVETAYEFLHALTGRLNNAGAVAHFHVDPHAHDERTVDVLLSLFDAEVDLSGDTPTARSRRPITD
ncbi:MAG: hypothetical protein ABEJ30_04655 [Halorientalis sp.]